MGRRIAVQLPPRPFFTLAFTCPRMQARSFPAYPMTPERPYLITNRLADVLALIQVLAIHDLAHRDEASVEKEMQRKPGSGVDTWRQLASQHPEFFRVKTEGFNVLALVCRHVSPRNDQQGRDPLTPEVTQALLTTAVGLHGEQLKHYQRNSFLWAAWAAIGAALITGFCAVVVAIIKACCGST